LRAFSCCKRCHAPLLPAQPQQGKRCYHQPWKQQEPLARLVDGKIYALHLDLAMIEIAKAETDRQGGSVPGWFSADACDIA